MTELRTERHTPKYIGQDMAEYLSKAKFEDLPAEVVKRAKHIVMEPSTLRATTPTTA